MFDIDWKGLILPAAYTAVLLGTFMTFSSVYRKRKAGMGFCRPAIRIIEQRTDLHTAQSANLAPWFPQHLQRNIYLSLLHLEPESGSEKSPKVPDSVLRAALLRRGCVGDDLGQRFTRAEKEMEEELRDVVLEVSQP